MFQPFWLFQLSCCRQVAVLPRVDSICRVTLFAWLSYNLWSLVLFIWELRNSDHSLFYLKRSAGILISAIMEDAETDILSDISMDNDFESVESGDVEIMSISSESLGECDDREPGP